MNRLQITRTGVKNGIFHDRSFVLLNEHHNMVTQRTKPKLSLIKTSFVGEQIWLDAPRMKTLKIDTQQNFSLTTEVISFQIWKQNVKGYFL